MAITISHLEAVDIHQAWPTEAGHFTPWLLENAGELSDILGVQVQLEAKEHKVGTFRLDLIGTVAGSDQKVIVENQYGQTDHQHLGQILTYAGGTEPAIVVWIAEDFREEHRAALDWLNANTVPQVRFFGVQLGVVRMNGAPDDLVAPRLELVCKPNDWEKFAKLEFAAESTADGGLTPLSALYKGFWEQFAVEAKKRSWTTGSPPAQSWWTMPSGTSYISWVASYTSFGCRSELYFEHPDTGVNAHRLACLLKHEEELQEAFGEGDLIFDPLPKNKAARLEVRCEGPKVVEEESWPGVIAWMVDTQERLRMAVQAVGGIPTELPSEPSSPHDQT